MEEEKRDYLMEKKIEYLIDMKVNKLKSDLDEATNHIKKMAEEIEVLKNKVQRLNIGVEPQTRLAGEKEVKKEKPNSKTGNFSSEDVSVDKIFYYGNK